MARRRLLSGNEAIALGAYQAGVSVASGYPGTPSTEILESLATCEGVHAQWSANEKVALEVGSGASYAGARVLVSMKHVGLNVAADPLFTLSYTGVGGGMVVVSADDPHLFSSQNEQDNRHYARAAKIPLMEPSDSQEARDFMLQAYEISERFDTPVLFRSTTRLSHSKSPVTQGRSLARRVASRPGKNPQKLVMIPAHGFRRHAVVEKRLSSLKEMVEEFPGNRIEKGTSGIGVISSGIAYQHAREVFPDASFLKLALTFPLPEGLIRKFAGGVDKLYVIEELDPFLEMQIRAMGIEVIGKDVLPVTGEYTPGMLSSLLLNKKSPSAAGDRIFRVPPRPPILCPGCPHRGVFHILGRKKYFVTGDIGCYTLAAIPPLEALDTCLCMGASIGQALGIEKAIGHSREKVAAVIGDSTFFHSGLTPLLDIVHNKGETTVIVLDNRTTAMTGRQDHPGVGKNLMGEDVQAVDIAEVARAIGIKTVTVTDAFNLDDISRAIEEAAAVKGSSMIVNRGPCVLLERRRDISFCLVDEKLCTGCKVCLSIACPAVGWDAGRVNARNRKGAAVIDSSLCTGCSICVQVCQFGAINEDREK